MKTHAVWLYGSEARGDSLPSSDVDIIVVGDGLIPRSVARRFSGRRLSVTRYEWEEINRMAGYGSLFLHHLRLEARVLYESPGTEGRLWAVLERLPHYQRVQRDVRSFQQSLLDIAAELPDPPNLEFELATLAALIRRIAILGSYLLDCPRFDRTGPVTEVVEAWKLPQAFASEFPQLYRHRVAAEDMQSGPASSDVAVLRLWLERAGLLLNGLEVQAYEPCRPVPH